MTAIRERPILFSGPMVRALLDGRKTQTRRVVKGVKPEIAKAMDLNRGLPLVLDENGYGGLLNDGPSFVFGIPLPRCPYGVPGDRLWVRETWQYADWTDDGQPWVRYAADETARFCEGAGEDESLVDVWAHLSRPENYNIDRRASDRRWRPSIHMPRWASRLTLTLTDVRVERVSEISTRDCWAEGIPSSPEVDPWHEYRELWDSLNAARGYGWDVNPWVWVLTFDVDCAAVGRVAA